MAQSFAATVSAWARQVPERYIQVVQLAAQELVTEMQRPGPSVANPGGGAGGHMPIRDGFLRASLVATFDGAAPVATQKPEDGVAYTWDAQDVNLTIRGARLGNVISLTYTAAYGRYVEARYAFVALAAQKWPSLVRQANAAARANTGA